MIGPRVHSHGISTSEITAALVERVSHAESNAVILREFVSPGGRIDLLVVSERLAGYEIKSDFDSLQRVDSQVYAFSRYCGSLTFVAGRRLAVPLLRALPIWCGVILAVRREERVTLVELRQSKANPHAAPEEMVTLLWRTELEIAMNLRTKGSCTELRSQFLASRTHDQIDESVALALRRRSRAQSGSSGG